MASKLTLSVMANIAERYGYSRGAADGSAHNGEMPVKYLDADLEDMLRRAIARTDPDVSALRAERRFVKAELRGDMLSLDELAARGRGR